MLTTDKTRLTAHLNPELDKKVRIFAIQHDKNLSELVEAMISHCLSDRHFIKKLSLKKEEEYDI